ncbi:MAG TPA: S53 family peptidase [Acidimicrobiales bacterium]|jgi:subtilase family serine protease|nr:S53 family peptidase [Acidimicrobiales bacterium]
MIGAPSSVAAVNLHPAVAVGQPTPLPRGATDLGAAPARAKLSLDVALQLRNPAALSAFVLAVSTPGSSLYHQFLAKDAFGPRFGATPAAIGSVAGVLRADGLAVGPVSKNDLYLPVTTTVGRAESAFGVRMQEFRLASGAVGIANVTSPRLPASIAGEVLGIVGLDGLGQPTPEGLGTSGTLGRPRNLHRAVPHVTGEPVPCSAAKVYYTAAEIAQAYGFDPLYNAGDFGAGQNVALVEFANYEGSDITAYQNCYATHVPIHTVGSTSVGTGNNLIEVDSDIEDVLALDPKLAGIDVYESSFSCDNDYTLWSDIESNDTAHSVSSSWGDCLSEQSELEPVFEAMGAEGQSVFSATGDGGSEVSETGQAPTPDPYVIAVGGTNLNALGNPPIVGPSEDVWNSSIAEGSGGGFDIAGAGSGLISNEWKMPSWQSGTGVINSYSTKSPCKNAAAPEKSYPLSSSGDCRETPDVSANAGGAYAMYIGGQWTHIGGTSLASPVWAALIALTDSSDRTCSSGIGFISPTLYSSAATTPADFNDITVGNNDYQDHNGGKYPATKGYDMASGLGSPEGANLTQSFCQEAFWSPQLRTSVSLAGPSTASSVGHTVYVAFTTSNGTTPSDVFYTTFKNGTEGTAQHLVIDGTAEQTTHTPEIVYFQGEYMIIWTAASNGVVESSSLDGGTWTAPLVLGAGKALSSAGPAAVVSGSLLVAAWKGHTTDNVYYSTYNGGSWSSQALVPGASSPYEPALAAAPGGAGVNFAWTTTSNTMEDEIYSITGFAGVSDISNFGTNQAPALTLLGQRLYVSWKGTNTDDVFYSSVVDGDSNWSPELTVPNGKTYHSPALAVVGPTLFTFWTGETTNDVYYAAADLASGATDYTDP